MCAERMFDQIQFFAKWRNYLTSNNSVCVCVCVCGAEVCDTSTGKKAIDMHTCTG
jgi:hypothetical protein